MRKFLWIGALTLILSLLTAYLVQAAPNQMLIIIDVQRMSLTLYENQKVVKKFPIAAGQWDTPSPLGTFRIVNRFRPESANGFGTCFLGLNVPWGNFGIHGTNRPGSIGSNASHGCFRMFVKDAEQLYKLAPNGTKVIVEGGAYGELGDNRRTLRPGDRNASVRLVQRKLRALGYYHGTADGIYGAGTAGALRSFLKDRGIVNQDRVDQTVYDALGIILFE